MLWLRRGVVGMRPRSEGASPVGFTAGAPAGVVKLLVTRRSGTNVPATGIFAGATVPFGSGAPGVPVKFGTTRRSFCMLTPGPSRLTALMAVLGSHSLFAELLEI